MEDSSTEREPRGRAGRCRRSTRDQHDSKEQKPRGSAVRGQSTLGSLNATVKGLHSKRRDVMIANELMLDNIDKDDISDDDTKDDTYACK